MSKGFGFDKTEPTQSASANRSGGVDKSEFQGQQVATSVGAYENQVATQQGHARVLNRMAAKLQDTAEQVWAEQRMEAIAWGVPVEPPATPDELAIAQQYKAIVELGRGAQRSPFVMTEDGRLQVDLTMPDMSKVDIKTITPLLTSGRAQQKQLKSAS